MYIPALDVVSSLDVIDVVAARERADVVPAGGRAMLVSSNALLPAVDGAPDTALSSPSSSESEPWIRMGEEGWRKGGLSSQRVAVNS